MYEDIEEIISKNGIEKSVEQIKADNPWLDLSDKQQLEWYKYDYNYPKELLKNLRKVLNLLRKHRFTHKELTGFYLAMMGKNLFYND